MSVDTDPLNELFVATKGSFPWSRVAPAMEYWYGITRGEKIVPRGRDEIDLVEYRHVIETLRKKPVSIECVKTIPEQPKNPLEYLQYERRLLAGLLGRLGTEDWNNLWLQLHECFAMKLLYRINGQYSRAWESIWHGIFFTCAYALIGDEEVFEECRAFLKVQEEALALGFKPDYPDTFLVLVA